MSEISRVRILESARPVDYEVEFDLTWLNSVTGKIKKVTFSSGRVGFQSPFEIREQLEAKLKEK